MTRQPQTDSTLLDAMRGGDEAALGAIIERYTSYVGSIVYGIVQGKLDHSDASELISDVFFSLWRTADRIEPGKLKAYLGRIARNRAVSALRGQREEIPLENDLLPIPAPGPEDEALRREEYAALRRTLDGLPEPDRSIFLRHYYRCETIAEIAGVMGIPANTIKSKLRRGRERLRRELTEGGYFIEKRENFRHL